MRISEYFELEQHGQENFEFLNLRVNGDNELFLDPTRIAAEPGYGDWSAKINDFHFTVFNLYENNRNEEARNLFVNSRESNEIFLGYSRRLPRGTGNSEDSLAAVYDYISEQHLYEDNLVRHPEEFMVFIPNFGPDHLSDFVASIIKHELVEFTIRQSDLNNIPRNNEFHYAFWNSIDHQWQRETQFVPEVWDEDAGRMKPLLLLPKRLVVKKFLIGPEEYLMKVVITWRQEVHRDMNSDIHRNRTEGQRFAKKDLIRDEEVTNEGRSVKDYLIEQTRTNTDLIETERDRIYNIQRGTNSNKLDDEDWENYFSEEEE